MLFNLYGHILFSGNLTAVRRQKIVWKIARATPPVKDRPSGANKHHYSPVLIGLRVYRLLPRS